jgi:hypothetical protein
MVQGRGEQLLIQGSDWIYLEVAAGRRSSQEKLCGPN